MNSNKLRDILATLLISAGVLNVAFGQNDITEYRDKIKPHKEYNILGQDILDVIGTIDSLKYMSDSLALKLQNTDVIIESVPDSTYETSAVTAGRTDTVFVVEAADTVFVYETMGYSNEFWIYIIIIELLLTIVGIVLFKLLKRWVHA